MIKKPIAKGVGLVCFIALVVCPVVSYGGASGEEVKQVKHQFVAVDNHKNRLLYVDEVRPERSWSTPLPRGGRDLQQLDQNRLLVSHGKGATEYDLNTGQATDWSVIRYRGVQSARRLPSGKTVLLTRKGQLITLDPKGKELQVINIAKEGLDLRLLRQDAQGHWIIGAKTPKAILVVDSQGNVLKSFPLPGKGYTVEQLPNGHYLASTGDACKVVELTPQGKIVRFFGGKQEHPSLKLDFNSGWHQLSNGNLVMTNWLGHGKHGTAPHLVEFNANNEVVWTWENHEIAKQITNVLIIK